MGPAADVTSLADLQTPEPVDQAKGADPGALANFGVPRDPSMGIKRIRRNSVTLHGLLKGNDDSPLFDGLVRRLQNPDHPVSVLSVGPSRAVFKDAVQEM